MTYPQSNPKFAEKIKKHIIKQKNIMLKYDIINI